MDRDDHDRELKVLRRRLAVLTEEARKNDDAWRRAQAREMELLEADTLDTLLERMTQGLKASYRLEAATLVVADPDHEIRRLLSPHGRGGASRDSVLFVDSVHGVAPAVAPGRRPWLGKFNRADHALLFPTAEALESVALLPLTRQERLIGCLNFGSRATERFQAALGTDFLHHLALIAAFALESAVNRARLVRSGFTDALTGWHNRRYLQSRLHEELARCRDESVRAVGRKMLERIGFTVVTAADGSEAIARFRERADEIICAIVDLTMPHVDGAETFRELRRMRPSVRVILSSGYNEQDVTQRFVGKGLAGFIQKPYQLSTLVAVLEEVLEKSRE